MASPTQWTWTWVNYGGWWGTGRPGMLQSTGSQRVGHSLVTEQQWKPAWSSPAVFPNFVQEVPYKGTFKLRTFKDANMHSINVKREWNHGLPSISSCWISFSFPISHLLSPLQSATLLACSLHASPCMPALLYWTTVLLRYCTVTLKMLSLFFVPVF